MLRSIPLLFILFSGLVNGAAQVSENMVFEGLTRSYIRYMPTSYQPGDPLPLVFVLHGFTQNAQTIMNFSGFNALAERDRFIVVYANGVNNGWNTNSGFPGGSTANDVGFLSALIDTMITRYGIDDQRVYSCGFSAGGFMSHRLACELSDRIAAIASVSGTMSQAALTACAPAEKTPILQIHGTSDLIVAYAGSAANVSVEVTLAFWTERNDCPASPQLMAIPDTVNEGSSVDRLTFSPCEENGEVVHLKVLNGGHTWPGANGNSGIGTTNRDISASVEIWDFFRRFTLSSATALRDPQPMDLRLYPNPARTLITLSTGRMAPSGRMWKIFNASGAVLISGTLEEEETTIDIRRLIPGLYTLVIDSGEVMSFTRLGE